MKNPKFLFKWNMLKNLTVLVSDMLFYLRLQGFTNFGINNNILIDSWLSNISNASVMAVYPLTKYRVMMGSLECDYKNKTYPIELQVEQRCTFNNIIFRSAIIPEHYNF